MTEFFGTREDAVTNNLQRPAGNTCVNDPDTLMKCVSGGNLLFTDGIFFFAPAILNFTGILINLKPP